MFHWRAGILPGVSAAFTNAGAGNLALHVGDDPSVVRSRRADLERAMGVAPDSLRFMNQVHGTAVATMEAGSPLPEADAMVSQGLPLAVMVADCIPVILAGQSDRGPVLSAVHAGRPGVAGGVIPAAVASMKSLGATGIRAWLGPSICGSCYEVPGALQDEVAAAVPATRSTTSWGTPGVMVQYMGSCTLETPSLYSYRRDRNTGRLAGLVWCHD